MSTTTSPALSSAPRKATGTSFQTLLQKYATAATAATFAVVGVSGVLLFFHLGEAQLMGVHEWLGLAFVGAAAFHVTRHLRSFSKLFNKTRTRVMFATTATITAAFMITGTLQSSGGNPMKQFVGAASKAPVAAVAQMVGKSPEALAAQFAQAGVNGVTAEHTLNDIAKTHQQDVRALFRIVMTDVGKE